MKIRERKPPKRRFTLTVDESELRSISFALYLLKQHHGDDPAGPTAGASARLHATVRETLDAL